ncbi:MAG TPA: carbohydrate kinase family protein [Candidatus Nanoarchaeia archaeon]|nr:carbohydrate kinase family protein [Candidatus Nanoarchaeia archaeon]
MYDIITIGSATLDVFARTRFSEIIKIIDPKGETDLLAFPVGTKILIDELDFTTGGGGTNTAVALARLGHKVGFVGKLGDGTNSEFIHSSLRKEKIDLLCSHGKGNSGYSVILDSIEHDRTILAYKGVNNDLKNSDVPYKKLKAKWFYFGAMMETSFQTLEKISEFAKKNKIKIAFNPTSYLAEKGTSYLKKILANTELLVLNKEEAETLAGKGKIEDVLQKLHKFGPKIVAVTDGKNDIHVLYDNHIYTSRPPSVKVLDSTGAGDAFASSMLSGILKKNDVEFAIRLGIVNSMSVITHYGAKNILLSYPAALKSMKKLKIHIKKKKL